MRFHWNQMTWHRYKTGASSSFWKETSTSCGILPAHTRTSTEVCLVCTSPARAHWNYPRSRVEPPPTHEKNHQTRPKTSSQHSANPSGSSKSRTVRGTALVGRGLRRLRVVWDPGTERDTR
uniref:Uncharacterized protein n=1 Tax=Molossus molossus TaxID=27622 RepID=A0A7J8DBZ5_MOLMO|nr:hypothetical protein HJG59_009377 [Molossus molossus]